MATSRSLTSRRSKTAILVGGALLAIAVLAYFAFFYPPEREQNLRGTIGGVKKYRSAQIDEKDVNLDAQSGSQIGAGGQQANQTAEVGSAQSAVANNAQSSVGSAQSAVTNNAQSSVGSAQSAVANNAQSSVGSAQSAVTNNVQSKIGGAQSAVANNAQSSVGSAKTDAGNAKPR